jgi:predicted metalloprotease with PDZ domain
VAVLDYRIDVTSPTSREVGMELQVRPAEVPAACSGDQLDLFLPAWTPGSYLVRDFARHLGRMDAVEVETGAVLPCEKAAKNRFRVRLRSRDARVRLRWRVYAHELSVRTADLTSEHAYWNHACLLVWPVGEPDVPARLTVAMPRAWELACALPAEPAAPREDCREVVLRARDLDHAMDAPVLAGTLRRLDWEVDGVPHAVVLDGLGAVPVPERLVPDLQAIVRHAARVFGGRLPYERYQFLCLFTADGHGGLEHADSTTLLASRTAFAAEKGYREFLSLAAHELFHAWNVKRLRPVEFWRYDYERENYTECLWLIEGWTAYYDDLLCQRAGLFTRQQYLEAAAKNVNGMLAAPGRFRLGLRESSFDAWIRLYKPDENTRNSSQNYYGNGAVAAMCLDLMLRRATAGARSLDDVLRGLYDATFARGRGYTFEDVQGVLREVAGGDAVGWLRSMIDERLDPDFTALLASFGVRVRVRDADRAYLGLHFESGGTVIASVVRGGPACTAGLHPGDELIAVDELRVDAARWPDVWQAVAKVGKPTNVLFARRGLVRRLDVVPSAAPGTVVLEVDEGAPVEASRLLAGWLAADAPAPPPASKPAV